MDAIAKADKRKDLMDNIKARLNSSTYNVTRHFRKNEKDLREKVKFFEKKIATGEMKDYMMPRFQQAQALGEAMQTHFFFPPSIQIAQ